MATWNCSKKLIDLINRLAEDRVYVETLMGIDIYVADDLHVYLVDGMDVPNAATSYNCDRDEMAIYVNSKLVNGPKALYTAICLHELGHIFNGHLSTDMRDCILVNDYMELEADAWAVARGADAQVLSDYLKSTFDLKISLIGEENYKQLVETNEAVKMLDDLLKARIAALSK